MAKAVVSLICAKCGAKFEITKNCCSRKEADNWEAYMSDCTNFVCSDCYKKQKQAECEAEKTSFVQNVYSKFEFPKIEGASEKQVKYAEDLRVKFVRTCLQPREMVYNAIMGRLLTDEKKREIAKLLETETSARKIIDTLKSVF